MLCFLGIYLHMCCCAQQLRLTNNFNIQIPDRFQTFSLTISNMKPTRTLKIAYQTGYRLTFIRSNETTWSRSITPRPSPIFRKFQVKIGQTDQKINFTQEKMILQIRSIVTLIAQVTTFHVEQSDFRDIKLLSSYMWKRMEVWQKSVFPLT